MGNEIFIQNKRVCVKPCRRRLEAIQNCATPDYSKGMQKFFRDGQFPKHVLPSITKIVEANL